MLFLFKRWINLIEIDFFKVLVILYKVKVVIEIVVKVFIFILVFVLVFIIVWIWYLGKWGLGINFMFIFCKGNGWYKGISWVVCLVVIIFVNLVVFKILFFGLLFFWIVLKVLGNICICFVVLVWCIVCILVEILIILIVFLEFKWVKFCLNLEKFFVILFIYVIFILLSVKEKLIFKKFYLIWC